MSAPAGRSLSLVPSLPTPVKGRAWRHRLLRAPAMSHMEAPRPSLKLPGMLDEPTAFFLLLLERHILAGLAAERMARFSVNGKSSPPSVQCAHSPRGTSGPTHGSSPAVALFSF